MIQFLVNNLVDTAVVSASTENAQFPVSNIKDDRRTKCYRSTSNSDNLVFDFGSPEPVDFIMIADNWQNGLGFVTATLEANGTNEWASPAFSTSIDLDTTYMIALKSFASQEYRFWRLVLTSTTGYCEVANLFIGSATALTTNGVNYNWSYSQRSLDSKSVNRYGQAFFDKVGRQKELTDLSFTIMNKDEIDVIHELDDQQALNKAFFVYFPLDDDNLVTNDNRYNGMYRLAEVPAFENTTAGYFNVSLSLEECK